MLWQRPPTFPALTGLRATQTRPALSEFLNEPLDGIGFGIINENNLEIWIISSLDEIGETRTKHVELATCRNDRGHPGRIR